MFCWVELEEVVFDVEVVFNNWFLIYFDEDI